MLAAAVHSPVPPQRRLWHETRAPRRSSNTASASVSLTVREVMRSDPVTGEPETSTLDAIDRMRAHKVGCLPVVEGDRLVGLVTEADFILVASKLLEESLREPSE